MAMLELNTIRGGPGENGLCAVPGREDDARAAIDQAIAYARAIGTPSVHAMAGFAGGPSARETFLENLRYACAAASPHDITILIEPLNHYDAPGYFLQTSAQAAGIIDALGLSNLKLMFDCYHVQLMEGDITHRLTNLMPIIGHIQIAGVPMRGEPDTGELHYAHVFSHLERLGYDKPIGAEYRPTRPEEDGLAWMTLRA